MSSCRERGLEEGKLLTTTKLSRNKWHISAPNLNRGSRGSDIAIRRHIGYTSPMLHHTPDHAWLSPVPNVGSREDPEAWRVSPIPTRLYIAIDICSSTKRGQSSCRHHCGMGNTHRGRYIMMLFSITVVLGKGDKRWRPWFLYGSTTPGDAIIQAGSRCPSFRCF